MTDDLISILGLIGFALLMAMMVWLFVLMATWRGLVGAG